MILFLANHQIQITTKKEESPELETPLTSVEKRVVKKNSLKALSEKQRKEEETTQNGTIVQISKVLNDKSLNHMAVNQQTTVCSCLFGFACDVFGVVRVFQYVLNLGK